jgi:hypothetical protein
MLLDFTVLIFSLVSLAVRNAPTFNSLICRFPTFQDWLSDPFPVVKVSNPYHATTQYSKDINYTVAAAWHLTQPGLGSLS